jgi:tetratricopeptide (TPR) repeat protein
MTSPLKPQLLALSEQVVDLGERIESDDPKRSDADRASARLELKSIGDTLVGLMPDAHGDDRAFLHFMLGSVCSYLELWEKAVHAYAEAVRHWPDHVGLLNEQYYAFMKVERYDSALEAVEASIRHGGETPDVMQNQAVCLAYLGRLAEAKAVMFRCIAKFPTDAGAAETLRELDRLG